MKKTITMLVLWICVWNTYAQTYSPQLKRKADAGNTASQVALGKCYYHGYGIEVDMEKAFQQFRKAAEKQNPEALCYMGYGYLYGEIGETDYGVAIDYFEDAKAKGFQNAKRLYEHVTNVSCDDWGVYEYHSLFAFDADLKEIKEIKKLADAGSGFNCFLYGMYCDSNNDKTNTFKYYKKAYDIFEKNEEKEIETIKKQHKKYDTVAYYAYFEVCTFLALCYEEGKGVEKNEAKALEIYSKITDDNFDWRYIWIPSHEYFPYMMEIGLLKKQGKIEKAKEAFELLNFPSAYLQLVKIYLDEKKYDKVLEVLNKILDYSAWGIECFELYPRAYADACYKLYEMYKSGTGVNKNERKADVYFKTALKYGCPCAIIDYLNEKRN